MIFHPLKAEISRSGEMAHWPIGDDAIMFDGSK
jgi:hypothetical protein